MTDNFTDISNLFEENQNIAKSGINIEILFLKFDPEKSASPPIGAKFGA